MSLSMLPAVLTNPTTRTISNSCCRLLYNFHTSSISRLKITNKPEIILRSNTEETSDVGASADKQDFCSILKSDVHKTLLQETQPKAILDILALYILASDIQVHQIALESNIALNTSNFLSMRRSQIEKIIQSPHPGIVFGSFSCLEDGTIIKNWEALINSLNLTDKDSKEIFENVKRVGRPGQTINQGLGTTLPHFAQSVDLKRNIVGYYLSQGLPNVRLATEVFHRAKILLYASKGSFTAEEDKIIEEFVETEGTKWGKLTKLLGRTSHQSVKHRYKLLQNRELNKKHGHFTVDEVKLIMSEVFSLHENVLEEENLTIEQCQNIGKILNRSGTAVYHHWKNAVEPMLKKYHAGSPEIDLKMILIQHLLDEGLYYTQEVDWVELAKDSKFAGTTPALLRRTYQNLRTNTKKKYPELRPEELSTDAIQRYLDSRKKYNKENRYKVLIDYYVENILDT